MKKTKLITAIVLIAVLIIATFATLVACKPDNGNNGNTIPSGGNTPSGSDPIKDPNKDPDDDDPLPLPPPHDFGVENPVFKLIDKHFDHGYAEGMGEGGKQVVDARSGKGYVFHAGGYGAGVGLGDDYRYAHRAIDFGQYQRIDSGSDFAGAQAENFQSDSVCFHMPQRVMTAEP